MVRVALESFKLFDLCLNWAVSINCETRGRGLVDPIACWVGYLWLPTLESWLRLVLDFWGILIELCSLEFLDAPVKLFVPVCVWI